MDIAMCCVPEDENMRANVSMKQHGHPSPWIAVKTRRQIPAMVMMERRKREDRTAEIYMN
jgi:hypothetical protein